MSADIFSSFSEPVEEEEEEVLTVEDGGGDQQQAAPAYSEGAAIQDEFAAFAEEVSPDEVEEESIEEKPKEQQPPELSKFQSVINATMRAPARLGQDIIKGAHYLFNELPKTAEPGSFAPGGILGKKARQVLVSDEIKEEYENNRNDFLRGVKEQISEDPMGIEEKIQTKLPVLDGYVEDFIEKGGKNILEWAAMPGGGIRNAIARGILGYFGENVGGEAGERIGGERGRAIGEVVGKIGAEGLPGLEKKLVGSSKKIGDFTTRELIAHGEKEGLSAADMMPALHSERAQNIVKILGRKGYGAQDKVGAAKKAIGGVYKNLKNTPAAKTRLAVPETGDFFNSLITQITEELPTGVEEAILPSVRKWTREVLREGGGISGKQLLNFKQDISNVASASRQGDVIEGAIMPTVENAIKKLDKEFFNDIKKTDKLYEMTSKLYPKLNKTTADTLFGLGEMGSLAAPIFRADLPAARSAILGVGAIGLGRSAVTQRLLNPRFQSMTAKTLKALNRGKYKDAKTIWDKAVDFGFKGMPKVKAEMKDVDFEKAEEFAVEKEIEGGFEELGKGR